jgi:hypothetical protein
MTITTTATIETPRIKIDWTPPVLCVAEFRHAVHRS